jgi:deoxypyrimidine-specific 5' nucleotidase type C protein (NT5C)
VKGVLCIDFDGVIADTDALKREWLAANYGIVDVGTVDRSSLIPKIGPSCYEHMQREVGFADTLRSKPIPGAVDALRIISDSFSVSILTARTPEKTGWVHRWLSLNDLDIAEIRIVSSHSRSKVDAAMHLRATWLIDNDLRHLSELPVSIQGVIFGSPAAPHPNLLSANDWSCLLEIVSRQNNLGY